MIVIIGALIVVFGFVAVETLFAKKTGYLK